MAKTPEQKEKRLRFAKELFSELLRKNDNYPGDVQKALETDMQIVEEKLKEVTTISTLERDVRKSQEEGLSDRSIVGDKEPQTDAEKIKLFLNFGKYRFVVKVNGKPKRGRFFPQRRRTPTQEFLLLEEVINRQGIIHWTSGFIIFQNWQNNVPKRGPIRQFQRVVTTLNNDKLGISVLKGEQGSSRPGDRCWKLDSKVKIVSTIEISKEKADASIKLDEMKQIIKLKEAYKCYPNSIHASKTLVDCVQKNPGLLDHGEELDEIIHNANYLLNRRKKDMERAVEIIQRTGAQNNWTGCWAEVEKYLHRMKNELSELKEYSIQAKGLSQKRPMTSDQANYLTITEEINKIRDDADKEHRNEIFESHVENEVIRKCTLFSVQLLWDWTDTRGFVPIDFAEIKRKAPTCLLSVYLNPRRTFDAKDLKKLKNKIIDGLVRELKKWYMDDVYEIPPNKFDSLFEFFRAKTRLREKIQIEPSDDELLEDLQKQSKKWNKDLIQKMRSYEEKIKGINDKKEIKEIYEEFNPASKY